jgi:Flp pilus assembly protein TadD
MLQARTQLQYWASSETLWSHALTITPENAVAHFNLGTALEIKGKRDEAILHYSEAVRIEPQYWDGQYNLGLALINTRNPEQLPEAASHLSTALRIKPDFPQAHNALGIDYLAQGKIDNAAAEFSEAIRLKPDYASAHNNLGTALGDEGQVDRAISEYSEAVRLDAGLTEARKNLGVLLAKRTAH